MPKLEAVHSVKTLITNSKLTLLALESSAGETTHKAEWNWLAVRTSPVKVDYRFGSDKAEAAVMPAGTLSITPIGCDIWMRTHGQHKTVALGFSDSYLQAVAGTDLSGDILRAELLHMSEPTVAQTLISAALHEYDPMMTELMCMTALAVTGRRVLRREFRLLDRREKRLQAAADYLRDNLERQVTLDELARAVHMSPFHLARAFKDKFGIPPNRYLMNARLERARMLLQSTPLPLSDVASDCGFASQSHFTTAFTREVGMSPGAFRKMIAAAIAAIAWVSDWWWVGLVAA